MALALNQSKQVASYQNSSNTGYVNSLSLTLNAAVAAGAVLIAYAGSGQGTDDVTITDDKGNTWTKIVSKVNTRSGTLWYAKNVAAGTTTIYATGGGSNYLQRTLAVFEYSGADDEPLHASGFSVESGYSDKHPLTIANTKNPAVMLTFMTGTSDSATKSYVANGATVVYTPNEYAPMVTARKALSSNANQTIIIDAQNTAYEEAIVLGLIITEKETAYVPRDTPPGAVNTTDWYPYGRLPNKTVAQLRSITMTFWKNQIKPYIVSTGMPSGMPAGALRVKRPENTNDTVSEGQAYAMIGAVYLGNSAISGYDVKGKQIFDNLWKYAKYYLNTNGVMKFLINNAGVAQDNGGATDADYDIAWALHMAHKVWGSAGSVNYAAERDALLNAILTYEHYSATHTTTALRNVMLNGDLFDPEYDGDPDIFDADYFAPAYYQEWANLNSRWAAVKAANQTIYSATDKFKTGMIPDHQKRNGDQATVPGLTGYNNTYNAVRRFRQVLDYLWYGSTLPEPYKDYWQHADLADFISTYSGGTLSQLHGEFNLQGTANGGYTNATFKSSYMVAMLLNNAHSTLAGQIIDDISTTPDGSYFGDTVTFMSLLTASGLFVPNPPAATSKYHKKTADGWTNLYPQLIV